MYSIIINLKNKHFCYSITLKLYRNISIYLNIFKFKYIMGERWRGKLLKMTMAAIIYKNPLYAYIIYM